MGVAKKIGAARNSRKNYKKKLHREGGNRDLVMGF